MSAQHAAPRRRSSAQSEASERTRIASAAARAFDGFPESVATCAQDQSENASSLRWLLPQKHEVMPTKAPAPALVREGGAWGGRAVAVDWVGWTDAGATRGAAKSAERRWYSWRAVADTCRTRTARGGAPGGAPGSRLCASGSSRRVQSGGAARRACPPTAPDVSG